MEDDFTLTLYAKSKDETEKVGALFFSHFILPLMQDGGPVNRVVVSAFGVQYAGKSTFCYGMAGKLAEAEKIINRQNGIRQDWRKIASLCRRDVGFKTNYQDNDAKKFEARRKARNSACGIEFANGNDKKNIFYIEHAALPHIRQSDVIIMFGVPARLYETESYLSRLEEISQKDESGIVGQINDLKSVLCGFVRKNKTEECDRLISVRIVNNTCPARALYAEFSDSVLTASLPRPGLC